AGHDRELARTHGVEPIELIPACRNALLPAVVVQAHEPLGEIIDRENTGDRVGLRALDALAQALRAVPDEHVVCVLATVWPSHTTALLATEAARQFILESLSGLVVIDGENPLPHGLDALAVRLEEREFASIVLCRGWRRAVRNGHATPDARHLDAELVDFAFDDDAALGLDVVEPVKDPLGACLHPEILRAVSVLHVHELIAAVVREGCRANVIFDLRHVILRRRHAIALEHRLGDATLGKPLDHRIELHRQRFGPAVLRLAPADIHAAFAFGKPAGPSAVMANPGGLLDIHRQTARVLFLPRRRALGTDHVHFAGSMRRSLDTEIRPALGLTTTPRSLGF